MRFQRKLPHVDPKARRGRLLRAGLRVMSKPALVAFETSLFFRITAWRAVPLLMRLTGGRFAALVPLPIGVIETRDARNGRPHRRAVLYFNDGDRVDRHPVQSRVAREPVLVSKRAGRTRRFASKPSPSGRTGRRPRRPGATLGARRRLLSAFRHLPPARGPLGPHHPHPPVAPRSKAQRRVSRIDQVRHASHGQLDAHLGRAAELRHRCESGGTLGTWSTICAGAQSGWESVPARRSGAAVGNGRIGEGSGQRGDRRRQAEAARRLPRVGLLRLPLPRRRADLRRQDAEGDPRRRASTRSASRPCSAPAPSTTGSTGSGRTCAAGCAGSTTR